MAAPGGGSFHAPTPVSPLTALVHDDHTPRRSPFQPQRRASPVSNDDHDRYDDDGDSELEDQSADERQRRDDVTDRHTSSGWLEGGYNPADFETLASSLSPELRQLFDYIGDYTASAVRLTTRLHPFVPDYIPAIGDIDAFIKVPAPGQPVSDVSDDGGAGSKPSAPVLGLHVLDEPCGRQSEPHVLRLQLRALAPVDRDVSGSMRQTDASQMTAAVASADDDPAATTRAIDKWIRDVSELHRCKPPPSVHYSRPMPDIEHLMAEWPDTVEAVLTDSSLHLPSAELQCTLSDYVDIVCAVLAVPVYQRRVHSLHVLFSLLSAFAESQHFGGEQRRSSQL